VLASHFCQQRQQETLTASFSSQVLDHMKVAWMSLDLATHVNMLGLSGHLVRDAPLRHSAPYIPQLLTHVRGQKKTKDKGKKEIETI
jgi:hypothetical protein